MDHLILIVLMERLGCLVDQLIMKELLRYVVIMLGEQYHIGLSPTMLLKQFAIS